MHLDNTFRPLGVKELEIFLTHLKSVIKIDHHLTFNFINSKYELLKWSAMKENLTHNKSNILVIEKGLSKIVCNFMRYKIIEVPISAGDFIKAILDLANDREVPNEKIKVIEFSDLELISEMLINNRDKNKSIAKQKCRFKKKMSLKSDYEIVFLMNIIFSKPYDALNIAFKQDKNVIYEEGKQSINLQRDFYTIMNNQNSLKAGPVVNNTY